MDADRNDDSVERRLAALEEASDLRRAELAALLHDLPAAVSRREVIASGLRDLRSGPGEGSVLRGVLRTIVRMPRALISRLRSRPTR